MLPGGEYAEFFDNPEMSNLRLCLCTLPDSEQPPGPEDQPVEGVIWLKAHDMVLAVASGHIRAQLSGPWALSGQKRKAQRRKGQKRKAPDELPIRQLVLRVAPEELEAAKEVIRFIYTAQVAQQAEPALLLKVRAAPAASLSACP